MLSRWLIMALLLAGIVAAGWLFLPGMQQAPKVGDAAPAFSLPDLTGTPQQLPTGQVLLINFWATWCPPCREEIPSLAALERKFGPKGLKVIAVSVDKSRNDLISFVREHELTFSVWHDVNAKVSASYGVYRYPESFIVDKNGVVQRHIIGATDWLNPATVQQIELLLERK